jgi:GNAT superfamily N-acetyltransferase
VPGPPIEIAKLDRSHRVQSFDCGVAPLNEYLKQYALQNQSAGGARSYVATRGGSVVGYYSLATAQVEYAVAPDRLRKGLARHPVPVILLARLAVDRGSQGIGLGAALLRDALKRAHNASEIIGVRAILVHAKDEKARRFYEHFDFDPSPIEPLQLFLLVKEVARLIEGEGKA